MERHFIPIFENLLFSFLSDDRVGRGRWQLTLIYFWPFHFWRRLEPPDRRNPISFIQPRCCLGSAGTKCTNTKTSPYMLSTKKKWGTQSASKIEVFTNYKTNTKDLCQIARTPSRWRRQAQWSIAQGWKLQLFSGFLQRFAPTCHLMIGLLTRQLFARWSVP